MNMAAAIRNVAARVQSAIEEGYRSRAIGADGLIEILLAIADELDPPTSELTDTSSACPNCGKRRSDHLVWQPDERICCATCSAFYRPGG